MYQLINETKLRTFIRRTISNFLDEVRYIPTYDDYIDKNNYDFSGDNEEPIKENEKIRVFHGTDIKTAVYFAKNGIDGSANAPRMYSFLHKTNPHGLFVTTSFKKSSGYSNGSNSGTVVLEFTANSNDIEAPVWHPDSTNNLPRDFQSKSERDIQKQKDYEETMNDKNYGNFIKKSSNPLVARSLLDDREALFFGQIDPNQIKRFWVKVNYKSPWEKYNLSEFLHKFGNKEYWDDRNRKETVVEKEKIYRPNEEFKGVEDFMLRVISRNKFLYNKYKKNGTLEQEIERYVENFQENIFPYDDRLYQFVNTYLYPKQALSLLGTEKYKEIMGEVWR